MTGGARHAHIVPVDVLEKHLSVPAGQSACLEHSDMTLMGTNSQRSTTTTRNLGFGGYICLHKFPEKLLTSYISSLRSF